MWNCLIFLHRRKINPRHKIEIVGLWPPEGLVRPEGPIALEAIEGFSEGLGLVRLIYVLLQFAVWMMYKKS